MLLTFIPMADKNDIRILMALPGVGKSIAHDLWNIGIHKVSDLSGQNADALYDLSNKFNGKVQDRCLLYVFRCAVYYANTPEKKQVRKNLNGGTGKTKNNSY
jgi:nucleotidyltransferase/DNA polymerase involved in DNA repair